MAGMKKKNGKSAAEKLREGVSGVYTMMEQEAPKMGKEAPIKIKSAPKKKRGM